MARNTLALMSLGACLMASPAQAKIRSEVKPQDLEFEMAAAFSVVHLFINTLEGSLEFMTSEKWSFVAIAGLGLIEISKHESHAAADSLRVTVGAQARRYATGTTQMGGYMAMEAMYFNDSSDQADAAGGFGELGVLFGYKETWADGLLFDLAVGAAATTAPERKKGSTPLQLLFNASFGYAF